MADGTRIAIFWFRHDLRLHDNAGLYRALTSGLPVLPVFIFDKNILDKLEDKTDQRVRFILNEVLHLKDRLQIKHDSSLLIYHSTPIEAFKDILKNYNVKEVFANRDYEPYAVKRDREIYDFLEENGITFRGFKDQVIFDKNDLLKKDGRPYVVYTPYMRKFKEQLKDSDLQPHPALKQAHHFLKIQNLPSISLKHLGFEERNLKFPSREIDEDLIRNYDKTRDFPGKEGTTRLGMHLRFGTISIRELARKAREWNETFFNELIWREFYMMILYHFPETVDQAFRQKYDRINWINNEDHFEKWCEGKTGYPMVDAGMRQLNQTGFMHNRVRMLVASFLTKHLLIDWRWGEAYFAAKLLDYEQASNVGNWQWAAGSGVDAQPYFRIFNPESQLKKFDKDLKYIKQWIPEYGTEDYPDPIVEHKEARERALERFKGAVG